MKAQPGGGGWQRRNDRGRLQLCARISSGGRISFQVARKLNLKSKSAPKSNSNCFDPTPLISLFLCRLKAEKEWERAAESLGELSQVVKALTEHNKYL